MPDLGRKMEYLLNTGNLISRSGLDLSQATGFTIVAEKLNFFRCWVFVVIVPMLTGLSLVGRGLFKFATYLVNLEGCLQIIASCNPRHLPQYCKEGISLHVQTVGPSYCFHAPSDCKIYFPTRGVRQRRFKSIYLYSSPPPSVPPQY